MKAALVVNGTTHSLDPEPWQLLVQAIRDDLGLTGTKVGCETSSCGVCTVLLDGRPVKSCTLLTVQADQMEVTTVEGLTPGEGLSPLQEAFRSEHGLQCGFCTPGMVVAATALLRSVPDPGDDQIRQALEGNLCRCTGYVGIIRAVRRAAAVARGDKPEPEAGRSIEEPLLRSQVAQQELTGMDIEVV